MKINERKLRAWIRSRLVEAGARNKDYARNWKQGDPLRFDSDSSSYQDDDYGDEYLPDEIRAQMSDEEAEMYGFSDIESEDIEDPYDAMDSGSMTLTLDQLVDTNVVPSVKSASGMDAWINRNVMEPLKLTSVDPETFEAIEKFRSSPVVKKAFQEVIAVALPVYIETASDILGQDASKLPELSDDEYIGPDGVLEEFFFSHSFLKPLVRQLKKDKTPKEAIKSVKDRWKYMNITNKASQFVSGVMTPMFDFLLRDEPEG